MLFQQPSQPEPQGVEAYFTDVEHLRDAFKNAVAAPTLTKRLFVIHGVGGVGKSSLLRMFRLHCKSIGIAVALASGDDAKSVVSLFYRKTETGEERGWVPDLKAVGSALPTFAKTLEHYRVIQAKVDAQAGKDVRTQAIDIAGKAASKTIEAAGGAVMGAAIGSLVPGIGMAVGAALGGALGGMSAEAFVDWLKTALKLVKPDVDLLLDPAKKLSEDFLADIAKIAPTKRIVLILDTYEQITALDDWAREIAQRLHPNVLLVIAGRVLPNWGNAWHGWMAQAHVEELKPMTEEVVQSLVRRYYATMRGGEPDAAQVDAIVRFARGLPIVVTSAVKLWVQYGVEDFQTVKPQVVADLVDRLMEGVPSEMIPALEAVATVRWFDKEILRAVTQQADVNAVYDELRRFPFARPRAEGFMLHDTVREMMEENLKMQDPERHCKLHERAATYFAVHLAKATGEEAERLGLERLYHLIRADEEDGVKLFQEMAEELVRYRLINRLQMLLNDANSYQLQREESHLWKEYYDGRLLQARQRFTDADEIYQEIIQNKRTDARLRAFTLSSWGEIRMRIQYVSQPGGLKLITEIIEQSNCLLPEFDAKRIQNLLSLGGAFQRLYELDDALQHYDQALTLCKLSGDWYWFARTCLNIIDIAAIRCDWKSLLHYREQALSLVPPQQAESSIASELRGHWCVALAWAGRYLEAEHSARVWLQTLRDIGEIDCSGALRDLGFSLGMQGKFEEAYKCFVAAIENVANVLLKEDSGSNAFWGATLIRAKCFQEAENHLALCWQLALRPATVWNNDLPYSCWLGTLHEIQGNWQESARVYATTLDYKWIGRRYFECGALAGLVRVKHAQDDYAAMPPLLAEAEQLAQQYDYNDHLASLRLTQAQVVWDGKMPEWGNGFDSVLHYYQHALIYALRYNRFLLDEVLWGGNVATPLRSIIPHCLKRGKEGKRMLVALSDWWRTGTNDIGAPRPDTISPIPEGIALLESERIAREREPGDGSPQKTVVEKIEEVLG